MSFRRGGAGKRRDVNEKAIRKALAAVGARSWQIGGLGLPDLLILHRGRFYAAEVKTEDGALTAAQRNIPWPVVRSVEEALGAIGIGDANEE